MIECHYVLHIPLLFADKIYLHNKESMAAICPICRGNCQYGILGGGEIDLPSSCDVVIYGGNEDDESAPIIADDDRVSDKLPIDNDHVPSARSVTAPVAARMARSAAYVVHGNLYVPTTTTAAEISQQIDAAMTIYEKKARSYLRAHQYIIGRYTRRQLVRDIPRGILLFHPMGTGKTIGIVSIATATNRPIIAIMPRTLIANMMDTVVRYCTAMHIDAAEIESRITYVSLDAYNMNEQIMRKTNGDLNGYTVVVDEAHELFTQICNANNINGPSFYNMVMRAVDIFLIFATGTPIEKDPYEIVPMANMIAGRHLFPHDYATFTDLYVGSNWRDIEHGDMDGGSMVARRTLHAGAGIAPKISTNRDDIDNNFNHELPVAQSDIDTSAAINKSATTYTMPNKWLLQNRLVGLISHTVADRSRFPRELPDVVIHVPMSNMQWIQYTVARGQEYLETALKAKSKRPAKKKFGDAAIGKASSKMSTTFRQKSCALCNVYRASDGHEESPKMDRIAADINKMRLKTLAYSRFKDDGVLVLAKKLIALGWRRLDIDAETKHDSQQLNDLRESPTTISGGADDDDVMARDDNDNNADVDNDVGLGAYEIDAADVADVPNTSDDTTTSELGSESASVPQFVVLSGDTPIAVREKYRDMFNDRAKNKVGEQLMAILATRVGTRGLTFIGGRIVIACEPYWTMARIRQLRGRFSRDGSHAHLPPEMQNMQMFVYLSDKAAGAEWTDEMQKWESPGEGHTSDTVLWTRAIKRQLVLDEFITVLKEVSIECSRIKRITGFDLVDNAGREINCYQCQNATRVPLYTQSEFTDLQRGNPCHSVVKRAMKMRAITVDGKKYMYSDDPATYGTSVYRIAIYYMDERVNSYMRMADTDPRFLTIYRAIRSDE
jgi:hypothetical protein